MMQSRLDDLSDSDTEIDATAPSDGSAGKNNSQKRNASSTEEEKEAVPDEFLRKKPKLMNRPLNEELLTSADGIVRIYEEFPRQNIFRGRGHEAQDVKKMVKMYKEWAFQLHPGIAFADIISRCEALGSRGKVKAELNRLRERERNKFVERLTGKSVDAIARQGVTSPSPKKSYGQPMDSPDTTAGGETSPEADFDSPAEDTRQHRATSSNAINVTPNIVASQPIRHYHTYDGEDDNDEAMLLALEEAEAAAAAAKASARPTQDGSSSQTAPTTHEQYEQASPSQLPDSCSDESPPLADSQLAGDDFVPHSQEIGDAQAHTQTETQIETGLRCFQQHSQNDDFVYDSHGMSDDEGGRGVQLVASPDSAAEDGGEREYKLSRHSQDDVFDDAVCESQMNDNSLYNTDVDADADADGVGEAISGTRTLLSGHSQMDDDDDDWPIGRARGGPSLLETDDMLLNSSSQFDMNQSLPQNLSQDQSQSQGYGVPLSQGTEEDRGRETERQWTTDIDIAAPATAATQLDDFIAATAEASPPERD